MPERSPQPDVAWEKPVSWGISTSLHAFLLFIAFCCTTWTIRSTEPGDLGPQLTVTLRGFSPKSPLEPHSNFDETGEADFVADVPFSSASFSAEDEGDGGLPGERGTGLPGSGFSVPSLNDAIGTQSPLPFEPGQAAVSSAKGEGPAAGSKARKAAPELVAEVLKGEAERAQREASQGSPVAIGMFGTAPVTGRKFVFALDRSKSMGTQGLNVLTSAQKEVTRAVGQLQSNHRFQVIIYNEETVMLGRRDWTAPTEDNRRKLTELFGSLGSHGATDHFAALQSALRLTPDVIFLVSDGADPVLNKRQQEKLIETAAGRTQIICLLFCRGKLAYPEAAEALSHIAKATGGTCHVFDVAATGKPTASP